MLQTSRYQSAPAPFGICRVALVVLTMFGLGGAAAWGQTLSLPVILQHNMEKTGLVTTPSPVATQDGDNFVWPSVRSSCVVAGGTFGVLQLRDNFNGVEVSDFPINGPKVPGSWARCNKDWDQAYATSMQTPPASFTGRNDTAWTSIVLDATSRGDISGFCADIFRADSRAPTAARAFLTWHDGTAYRTAWSNTFTLAGISTWNSMSVAFTNFSPGVTALPSIASLANKTFLVELYPWGNLSDDDDNNSTNAGTGGLMDIDNFTLNGSLDCGLDYGDYNGFASAAQTANSILRIGTLATDEEAPNPANATATGDDNVGDDEDLTMPSFTVGSATTLSVPITLVTASLSGNTSRVQVYADWNGDGDVLDTNETITAQAAATNGNSTLTFSLTPPVGTTGGTKYLRIRAAEGTTHPGFSGASALRGEVEDYAITVTAFTTDFGDHTTFASASQTISTGIRIGTNATDGEAANPTTGTANADDATGVDDEDLVIPILIPGNDTTLSIPVTLAGITQGRIGAWVDWNGDGNVAGTGEVLTLSTTSLVAGAQIVKTTLSPPASKTPVAAYLRVRVTEGTIAPSFSGFSLLQGEVEDYALSANCPTITLSPTSLSNGTLGTAYAATITAGGGSPPYDFAIIAGSLPPDLKFNPATGEITGTPTAAGTYNFTILAVDEARCEGSRAYSITAVSATTDYGDLPDTAAGTATGNYNTLSTDSGASHTIDALTRLGLTVDGELQALPNAFASGDGADEDGVTTWPNFQRGSTVTLPVSVFHNGAAASVFLRLFVDWNNDGDFLDASETITAVSVAKSASQQTINVSVTVPASAALECVGLRVRLSATAGLGSTGFGDLGEVEDYFITVLNSGSLLDYGDHVYGSSANSASNVASNVIRLGATAPDAEAADPATSAANADDLTGNDEDYDDAGSVAAGYLLASNIVVTTCSAMPVAAISVWVDWNGDGDVADAGETVLQSNTLVPGTNNLFTAFNPPPGTAVGVKYVRYRVQEGSALPSFNATSTLKGEVEDGIITVTAPTFDYGDCSLLPSAWATTNATLYLGTTATDVEGAATTNSTATVDDTTGTDDEDGVSLLAAYASGMSSQVSVIITNNTGAPAYLSGWIDFNNTPGTVEANEIIINNVAVISGTTNSVITYTFTVPANQLATRVVCARFRLSSTFGTGISDTGGSGEVEDYIVKICPAQACGVTGIIKN